MIKTKDTFIRIPDPDDFVLELAQKYQLKADLTDFEAIVIALLDNRLGGDL